MPLSVAYRSEDTIFVDSTVTAPFLAEPYFSTDGFVIKHGHIASEVSTFDGTQLNGPPLGDERQSSTRNSELRPVATCA